LSCAVDAKHPFAKAGALPVHVNGCSVNLYLQSDNSVASPFSPAARVGDILTPREGVARMDRRELLGALGALSVAPVCAAAGTAAPDHGGAKTGDGPMTGPHLHFCGIHMAKTNDKLQFITQHYCAAHTGGKEGDVFQCVLFDGAGKNAKLVG